MEGTIMSTRLLEALPRTEKPKKVRNEGFVPGVIYGKGMDSLSVKFTENKLQNILRNAKMKVSVQVGEDVKSCFIREIQKDPVTHKVIHVSLQVVREDEIVRLSVPLVFANHEELTDRKLYLQTYLTEAELSGPSAAIPEAITIDVGSKDLGDRITAEDLQALIPENVKLMDDPETLYAVITAAKTTDIAEEAASEGEAETAAEPAEEQ